MSAPLPRAALTYGTRLQGRRLLVARALWLVIVLATMGFFLASLPVRYAELIETVHDLSPAQELVLRDLGISPDVHVHLVYLVEVAVPLVFLATALLVFGVRSSEPLAMLISAAFVPFAVWVSPSLDTLAAVSPEWRLPVDAIQAFGMVVAVIFFYLFPDGRFVLGWTRPLSLALVGWGVAWVLLPDSPANLSDPFRLPLLSFALDMGWWTTGVVAQVYRFVRVAGSVQRQQTKWVFAGVVLAVVAYLLFGYERFARPFFAEARVAGVVYDLVGVPLYLLTMAVIPVAFALSILRYRLWDIDFIISRALVYAVLTAVLGGLYTASITLSQRLFVALTGERSDAAIVLTTLIVATASTQLKGTLQAIADRHLKHAPDPTRNLRSFRDEIRSVVELLDVELVTRRALDEAINAFDATGGAVYLRRHGRFEPVHVAGEWSQVEGMSAWLQAGGEPSGWIVLGPRRHGQGYSEQDEATLAGLAALVSRAMRLLGGLGHAPSPATTSLSADLVRTAQMEVVK